MAHTVNLNTSVLIQDTGGTAPVTVAQDSKQDQATGLPEYLETVVVLTSGGGTATVSFTPYKVMSLYVKASGPVSMVVGGGVDTLAIRSVYAETYASGDGPTQLAFTNSGTSDVAVTVIAGSDHP